MGILIDSSVVIAAERGELNLDTATVHATLAVDLGRTGLPMGAHDLLIAATAVRLGYSVATRDRRSFGRIEGLDVEYW